MERINAKERDRKFCLHGIEHSLDTARIGYISILENGLPIDKELFYAAALLHDTGRYSGMPHHEAYMCIRDRSHIPRERSFFRLSLRPF